MVIDAKITLVRWANTAIVLSYITPFTKTISDSENSLIPSVLALFFTETFTAPIIKYLDIVSNIKKHLLAPRKKTQQSMNVNFNGTPYYLAERYTDMTKVLFVTCFYSAIFPPAYFFGALSLFMYYWIDKFLVMVRHFNFRDLKSSSDVLSKANMGSSARFRKPNIKVKSGLFCS